MVTGIGKYNYYDILFRKSMTEIKGTNSGDPATQGLFGAAITAMYGSKVNADIMKDVNTFVEGFNDATQNVADATNNLTETFKAPEPIAIKPNNINPTVQGTREDEPAPETNATNETEEAAATEANGEEAENVEEVEEEEVTTTENNGAQDAQTAAVSEFANQLNNYVDFLNENNRNENTDLLKRQIEFDYNKNEGELEEIGITKNEEGQFTLNEETFRAALEANPEKVTATVTDENGFVAKTADRVNNAQNEPVSKFAFPDNEKTENPYFRNEMNTVQPAFESANQLQIQNLASKGSIIDLMI